MGPYQYDDGSYLGQYLFGRKHGYGTFVRNNFCGTGILKLKVMADGGIYEGFWENDNEHGTGRIIYYDGIRIMSNHLGESYDGDWIDGSAHGMGTFVYKDGT